MESSLPKKETHRIIIRGEVQGVCFRVSAKTQADLLRLKGYVKNLKNGDVECLVEGDAVKIKKFVDWCHIGPAYAVIKDVSVVRKITKATQFIDFSIIYE